MSEEIFKIEDEEGNLLTIYNDSYKSVKITIEDCEVWLCLNKEMVNKLINALTVLERDL